MSLLEPIDNEGRIFVAFPFEAKDDFRANFSKARWHPEKKMWSVAPESRERLEQWCGAVKEARAAADSPDAREALMTQQEIERTQAALARGEIVRGELAKERQDIEKLKGTLEKTKRALALMRDYIDSERATVEVERREQQARQQEIQDALAGLVDYQALEAAHGTMKRFDHSIARPDIQAWEAAQLEIIDARNTLRNANLTLEALEYLSEVKQGRDLVRQIMPGAWYAITKLKA